MKVLILGGDGMLGHEMLRFLSPRHDVRVTLRRGLADYCDQPLFSRDNAWGDIDVRSIEGVGAIVREWRPQTIVNAVGIVKQRASARESIPSLEINALLPHRLALLAQETGAQLIHFSTDCVFSGRKGGYVEDDFADADDLYGRSKLLGEVGDPHCITVRTSIIGRQLSNKTSLVEWFLAQQAPVAGFRRAIYSGFTTTEMARIVEMLMTRYRDEHGVWHVSSEPISKYDLLKLIKATLNLKTEIRPEDDFVCNRSLNSDRFRNHFDYSPPAWEAMIADVATLWKQP